MIEVFFSYLETVGRRALKIPLLTDQTALAMVIVFKKYLEP